VTYRADTEWRCISIRRRDASKELPERVETWIGRQDKLTDFLNDHPLGSTLSGGYIVARDTEDRVPKGAVELTIAYAPDFQANHAVVSRSIKTATKSANITSTSIIDGATTVAATREISFYAPETRYEYFNATAPAGPRYSTQTNNRQPTIIRSRITATGDNGVTVVFAGNAPSALLSALAFTVGNVVVSDGGEPIKGTPGWHRCVDVVSLEFIGDT
jgi:hypothetical protein